MSELNAPPHEAQRLAVPLLPRIQLPGEWCWTPLEAASSVAETGSGHAAICWRDQVRRAGAGQRNFAHGHGHLTGLPGPQRRYDEATLAGAGSAGRNAQARKKTSTHGCAPTDQRRAGTDKELADLVSREQLPGEQGRTPQCRTCWTMVDIRQRRR